MNTLCRSVQHMFKHWKDCADACLSMLFLSVSLCALLDRCKDGPKVQVLKAGHSWV